MRIWLAVGAALIVSGCGSDEPSTIKIDTGKGDKKDSGAAEIKSDPQGRNQCLACGIKTNDSKCPKCGTVLKAEAPAPKPASSTAKPSEGVGKSTTSAVYECPRCQGTFPSKGECLKCKGVQMKLRLFVCGKCDVKAPEAGECSKCGAALVKELQ